MENDNNSEKQIQVTPNYPIEEIIKPSQILKRGLESLGIISETNSNILFPLDDGVILGRTTVKELKKNNAIPNKKFSQNVYKTKEGYSIYCNSPYSSGIAVFYYFYNPYYCFVGETTEFVEKALGKRDCLPEKWLSLGMNWNNTYEKWIDFAKEKNMDIFENQHSLWAGNADILRFLYTINKVTYYIDLTYIFSTHFPMVIEVGLYY